MQRVGSTLLALRLRIKRILFSRMNYLFVPNLRVESTKPALIVINIIYRYQCLAQDTSVL